MKSNCECERVRGEPLWWSGFCERRDGFHPASHTNFLIPRARGWSMRAVDQRQGGSLWDQYTPSGRLRESEATVGVASTPHSLDVTPGVCDWLNTATTRRRVRVEAPVPGALCYAASGRDPERLKTLSLSRSIYLRSAHARATSYPHVCATRKREREWCVCLAAAAEGDGDFGCFSLCLSTKATHHSTPPRTHHSF